jgi:hypothetical protein
MKLFKISDVLLSLMFVVGLSLLLYPSVSNYWNSFRQTKAVASYENEVANLDKDKYQEIWDNAIHFNQKLVAKGLFNKLSVSEEQEYNTLLNVDGTSMMGFVSIPSINVYWDVSGSFPEGSEKTKMAERAIAAINTYVNSGDIITTSWYFADRVSSTRSGAGGGTRGTPILEHVKQTKPTNVIVITDDDISDCHEEVKVPGAVWYLFFGRGSENIASHLVGKRQTRSYVVNI